MNRARRRRQKYNRVLDGGHSVLDHAQREDPKHPSRLREDGTMTGPHYLPVSCTVCSPPRTTGFKEETRKAQLARPNLPKGWSYKFRAQKFKRTGFQVRNQK